jgi:transcriptional regulator with XRE-family HTH domain
MARSRRRTLRELREQRGLTRQQVATDLGISERTVIRHEDGTTPLRRVHLLAYADYYGVAVDSLTTTVVAT